MKPLDADSLPLHGTHLIEASAGTGKTHTLATLYVRLIVERELDVARIALVTFTDAAARELGLRVRELLHQHASPLARLALQRFDAARIGTIHRLFRRLLDEFAFEVGRAPTRAEPSDGALTRTEAVRDLWRNCMVRMSGAEYRAFVAWCKNVETLDRRVQEVLRVPPEQRLPPRDTQADAQRLERLDALRARGIALRAGAAWVATWAQLRNTDLLNRGEKVPFRHERLTKYEAEIDAWLREADAAMISAEPISVLRESTRLRMISEVPLGAFLSGGIDSSTVAAFAVQHATEKVKTFSIGFEEDSFDESRYARQVAHHLGTEHYEATLSVDTAADLIGEIGHWMDEPLSDGSLIPTLMLARFVRHHVTVALGGDGGDELFAGYPMYYGHKVARMYQAVPRFLRSGLIEPVVNRLPVSTRNISFEYRAKRFVRSSGYDTIERHHSWFGSFSAHEQDSLLTADIKGRSCADVYHGARELLQLCDARDEIERMQFLDLNYYMAEDILTKVDRASMAVSLETRAPFLDPRIGEFAAALPLGYKLRGSTGKYILKRALADLLPHEFGALAETSRGYVAELVAALAAWTVSRKATRKPIPEALSHV